MTSKQTNEEIKRILDKYLTNQQQVNMFDELAAVKGNKSFIDTIKNLKQLIWQQSCLPPSKKKS